MMVTLFYASLLGLLYLVLAGRVGRKRMTAGISFGAEGDQDLAVRMRVQANFVEYVPLLLILMLLLESLNASRYGLHAMGILLLVARILHAIGLSRGPQVNLLRASGAAVTVLLLLVACLWGLWRAVPAL